ncbi:activating signal cointegrator 1 complex subunit 1-like [Phlebotomus argentipes]|uniref:activating signal cointegrator 1 complex subunit 1-like n=1 Tax=Phlebotomus argentipes TaxID=94469 RepID=UPI002892C350|nr:activating signal cointegrator 1 complex subunit 1-like [Phlebotomus argentipes]
MMDDREVEEAEGHTFSMSFYVPRESLEKIFGKEGVKRKRLETTTRTQITVSLSDPQEPIVVTSGREEYAEEARKQIEELVASSRRNAAVTHFVSIPCCSEDVKQAFDQFKRAVLAGPPVDGLTEKMFQNPLKLHLTLTVMVLMNEDEVTKARELLHGEQDAIQAILVDFGGKAEITIQGVDIMNSNPERTRVVYAKIQSEALQKIANHVEAVFGEKKLGKTKSPSPNVKLHMTLINSRYRKTFNASRILDEFKDFPFGSIQLTEIHLSDRASFDDKGYYTAITTLSF